MFNHRQTAPDNRKYMVFTTSRCTNDCILCGVEGENRFKFHHVGSTEDERKGLENFIKSNPNGRFSLTGGDPLRNEVFIDLLIEHHKGPKNILFNPLTMFSMEAKKSAKHISADEAMGIYDKVLREGHNDEVTSLIEKLGHYSYIESSIGNLQSPNHELAEVVKEYFEDYLRDAIKGVMKQKQPEKFDTGSWNEPYCGSRQCNAKWEGNHFTEPSIGLGIVGRMRDQLSSGQVTTDKLNSYDQYATKTGTCDDTDSYRMIHFKKIDGEAHLVFMPCCKVGVNDHTCYVSDFTLEQMAKETPDYVRERMQFEFKEWEDSPIYRVMNREFPWLSEKDSVNKMRKMDYKSSCKSDSFEYLIGLTEQMIEEKTGEKIDIVMSTSTIKEEKAKSCEVCSNLSLYLNRAKITREEWQDYIADELIYS